MDIKPHDEWCAYEPANNLPDGGNASSDKHNFEYTHNHKKQQTRRHTHLQETDWQTENSMEGEVTIATPKPKGLLLKPS